MLSNFERLFYNTKFTALYHKIYWKFLNRCVELSKRMIITLSYVTQTS